MGMSYEAPPPPLPKVENVRKDEVSGADPEKAAFGKFSERIVFEADTLNKSIAKKDEIAKIDPKVTKSFQERISATVIESHVEAMFAGKEKPDWASDPKVQAQMRELVGNLINKSEPENLKAAMDKATSLVSKHYDSQNASLIDPDAISTINKIVEVLPPEGVDRCLSNLDGISGDFSKMKGVPKIVKKMVMSRFLGYADYAVDNVKDPEVAGHILDGIFDVLQNENISKLKMAFSFSEDDIDNIIAASQLIKEKTKDDEYLADGVWNLWSNILNQTNPSLDWLKPENKLAEKVVELGVVVDRKLKQYPLKKNEIDIGVSNSNYTAFVNEKFKPSDLDKLIVLIDTAKSKDEVENIFAHYYDKKK